MAFVFMGKGVRELQEGNALPLTTIPGFPHSEFLGIYPSWQGVLAQLALLLLAVFAALKTFWPKRSVTLPTVIPTPGTPPADEIAAIRAENDELRRRLAALEEAIAREPARN
jgi:high-affinity iron transporter